MISSMKANRRSAFSILWIATLLLSTAVSMLTACGRAPESSSSRTANAPSTTPDAQAEKKIEPNEIAAKDLPDEARTTLQLIKQGGPFHYAKDGTVFGNREGILPAAPRGYYHEYTVKTPGERDRGARRIISGKNGEYFYTDDHYRSFRRIRE